MQLARVFCVAFDRGSSLLKIKADALLALQRKQLRLHLTSLKESCMLIGYMGLGPSPYDGQDSTTNNVPAVIRHNTGNVKFMKNNGMNIRPVEHTEI